MCGPPNPLMWSTFLTTDALPVGCTLARAPAETLARSRSDDDNALAKGGGGDATVEMTPGFRSAFSFSYMPRQVGQGGAVSRVAAPDLAMTPALLGSSSTCPPTHPPCIAPHLASHVLLHVMEARVQAVIDQLDRRLRFSPTGALSFFDTMATTNVAPRKSNPRGMLQARYPDELLR